MSEEPETGKENAVERNLGVQPLDALMREHGLTNHDVVAVTTEPLTHKAVQRARTGRRLTAHTQRRVVEAVNRCLERKQLRTLSRAELFNYEA